MGWIYKGRFVSAYDEGTARFGGRPTSIHDDPAYYPIFGEPKKQKEIEVEPEPPLFLKIMKEMEERRMRDIFERD